MYVTVRVYMLVTVIVYYFTHCALVIYLAALYNL